MGEDSWEAEKTHLSAYRMSLTPEMQEEFGLLRQDVSQTLDATIERFVSQSLDATIPKFQANPKNLHFFCKASFLVLE